MSTVAETARSTTTLPAWRSVLVVVAHPEQPDMPVFAVRDLELPLIAAEGQPVGLGEVTGRDFHPARTADNELPTLRS